MSRRMLVVDDEAQMVRTFRDILALHGWETDGAFSGEEALAALEREPFDAVLMDVRMPGMNGVETLARMKELRPGVRVILMTAYSASGLIDEAEREGALAIVPKPVRVPVLVEMLEEALGSRGPVLVIDDDPSFLRTLGDVLRRGGYDVLEAGTLDDAVDRLREASPRVVLLDLRLDHLDPHDSVVAIRDISPAVTLILYSGHPKLLDETADALPSRWVHAALHKPFAPEKLISLLEDVLDG